MPDLDEFIKKIALAHRSAQETWQDDCTYIRRVPGGMNNALYYLSSKGLEAAFKLCVPDERQRAHREYGALTLLQNAGADLCPVPLGLDDTRRWLPYPVVIYEWLSGEQLSGAPSQVQWELLADNYQRLHAVRCDTSDIDMPVAFFHWFDRAPYLEELEDFVERYTPWLNNAYDDGLEITKRLRRLIQRCVSAFRENSVNIKTVNIPLCLCRVDPNPANIILGPDNHLRWVDWEFSGWGDPALDLADLRWHAAFLEVDIEMHQSLRARYKPLERDRTFYKRLALWDSLVAVRWPLLVLRLLWSQENGPDRLRLTKPSVDKDILWARLENLIVRAELFYGM